MSEEIRRQIRVFLHQTAPNFKERQAITELAGALFSRVEAAEAERDALKLRAEAAETDLREVYRGMREAGIEPNEGETHGAAIARWAEAAEARAVAAEGELLNLRAPGGWRPLMMDDAIRALGDPRQGVSGVPDGNELSALAALDGGGK